jgi:hypothetical protein
MEAILKFCTVFLSNMETGLPGFAEPASLCASFRTPAKQRKKSRASRAISHLAASNIVSASESCTPVSLLKNEDSLACLGSIGENETELLAENASFQCE